MSNPTRTDKVWKTLLHTSYSDGRIHTQEMWQFETEVEALRHAIWNQPAPVDRRTLITKQRVFVSHETANRLPCGGYNDDSHTDRAGKKVYDIYPIKPKTQKA